MIVREVLGRRIQEIGGTRNLGRRRGTTMRKVPSWSGSACAAAFRIGVARSIDRQSAFRSSAFLRFFIRSRFQMPGRGNMSTGDLAVASLRLHFYQCMSHNRASRPAGIARLRREASEVFGPSAARDLVEECLRRMQCRDRESSCRTVVCRSRRMKPASQAIAARSLSTNAAQGRGVETTR